MLLMLKELGKKLEVVGGPAEDLAQGYKKFKGWINSDNHPVKKLGFGSWLYDVCIQKMQSILVKSHMLILLIKVNVRRFYDPCRC